MNFYLGTHMPNWLASTDVPLFVSHRRLVARKTFPSPLGRWALDSGGFTELSMFGEWRTTPAEYVSAVKRYRDNMPGLDWVAPQDWMCEPFMLEKTGRAIAEHQSLTVGSFCRLRDALGPLVVPVLQGWGRDDYLRCWEMYDRAGVTLEDEPTVGLGSVCRRQAMGEAEQIVWSLQPLRLHGFGMKTTGLRRYAAGLASADSMAWSYTARMRPPLPGHTHKACNNCLEWALLWRGRIFDGPAARQLWGV